jgi:hypothetical protein
LTMRVHRVRQPELGGVSRVPELGWGEIEREVRRREARQWTWSAGTLTVEETENGKGQTSIS